MSKAETAPTHSHPDATKAVQITAWSIAIIFSVLAIMAWGNDNKWQVFPLNNYLLFPLAGLLAYSLMWSHYVSGAIRELFEVDKPALKRYFTYTSYVVLGLLLLHPSLLIWQLYRDGSGLPPGSYASYVAPGLGWITYLGTASLIIFLAFEFRRKYSGRSWWPIVAGAGDIAMLAIFYHGLRLGSQLSSQDWYRGVWLFMGITLVIALAYKYRRILD